MDLYRWLRNQWDRTLAIVLGLAGLLAIYLGYRGVRDGIVPAAASRNGAGCRSLSGCR